MPRGGRRPGAGRPKGAKDRYLRDKPGKKQTIQQAERFLRSSGAGVFEGDSVALLVSIYKDERLPLNIRQNAAIAASPFERPRMSDQRVLLIEQREKEAAQLALLEQNRDADAEIEAFRTETIRIREQIIAERDLMLQSWVSSGELTPEMAAKVRALWAEPDDRPATFHQDQLAMPDLPGAYRGHQQLALPPPRETPSNNLTTPQEPQGSPPASETPASGARSGCLTLRLRRGSCVQLLP